MDIIEDQLCDLFAQAPADTDWRNFRKSVMKTARRKIRKAVHGGTMPLSIYHEYNLSIYKCLKEIEWT